MKLTISATALNPRGVHCLALLAAFILVFAPQLASAAKEVPFRAAFVTEFESVMIPPIVHIQVIGEGNATHLGKATAVTIDQEVNFITGQTTATYTFTGANGDTVVLEMEFETTFLPGGVTFTGTYTVTEGTGRFTGATGSGTLIGSAAFTGPSNGVGSFTVAGTISSPGSLK